MLPDFLSEEQTEEKKALKEVNQQYCELRRVYRARHPRKQEVLVYKENAVKMGQKLIKKFPWARWPNYLHRVIEYVQEIIEKKGSTGAFRAEGSEGNNKQTLLFRMLRSRTSSAASSMEDVLKICWLVTSKKLQRIAKTSTRSYCCSNCGDNGHSVRTCPALNNAQLDETLGEMHTLEIHN